jgi:hypothetical protein
MYYMVDGDDLPTLVVPRVYIGSKVHASQLNKKPGLKALGIKRVLNVTPPRR